MELTDLEFSIGEISGPPNQLDHSHSFNNDKEDEIVKDLEDFVALNLHNFVEKEGVGVVLCNAVMATDKKIEGLKEQIEQALKKGERNNVNVRKRENRAEKGE
ncbi:1970_t:CDS:1, partial [Paraglomus brasilianum]